MKATKAVTALEDVARSKTFNSTEGRAIQKAGRLALVALPTGIDPVLIGKVLHRYLSEAPYTLWTAAGKLRPEHAPALLAELRRARKSLQVRFLLAAADPGDLEAVDLRQAASLLQKLALFSRAAKDRAAVEKLRPVVSRARVVAAIQGALAATPRPDLTELKDWLWFGSLLAMEGSPKSVATLRRAAAGKDLRPSLQRLVKHFGSDRGLAGLLGELAS